MDFFKFFDWPRKIDAGTPATGLQGNIAVTSFSGLYSRGTTLDKVCEVILNSSGRPVKLSVQPRVVSGGVIAIQQWDNTVTSFSLILEIRRNGVKICPFLFILNGVYFGAANVLQLPISISFLDINAPSGNNTYSIYIQRSANHVVNFQAADFIAMEL